QFPKKVGRMVLDGVLPPDLTMAELNAGQAKGFETALDAYLASCTKESDCPLGSEPAAGKKKLQEFLAGLDDKTVRAEGDSRIDRLTEGWAVNGIAAGLYDEASWPGLTDALRGAMNGDGTLLL
ncbi:alpha/beta fold hydrolase, partial [Xanthomonas citri pv. citri]|nr:alpha/beta fold hydrolase [Xanthomonas citri pv. citri]